MASIFKRPSGTYVVEIYLVPDKKTKIGLSTKSQREAMRTADRVQSLLDSKRTGVDTGENTAWLMKLAVDSPKLYNKLVRLNLAVRRAGETMLRQLVEMYCARSNAKAKTVEKYQHLAENLYDFFGEDTNIKSLQPCDADRFMAWLRTPAANKRLGTPYAISTINRRITHLKTLFSAAVRWELLEKNPFRNLRGGACVNTEKWEYVPQEKVLEVLEKCVSPKWAAIVALGRFAGARGASELHNLRWEAVGEKTIMLKADKKDGTPDKIRTIPLSSPLKATLQKWRDASAETSGKVFPGV